MKNYKISNGFTLIELMIAVAIVGILASVAIPSYQDSIRKSRRADAQGALMNFTNSMERHFTQFNNYCNAGGSGGAQTCSTDANNANDTGTPSIYAPPSATAQYYNFTISAADNSTYTLTATPTGAQANDKCGTLTLDHTGVTGIADADTGVQAADCW